MFKKIFLLTTIFAVGVFAFAADAWAEKIGNFNVFAKIEKDGVVNLTEYIQYDFEQAERHGIFREIPLLSKDGPQIAIEVLGVSSGESNVPFVSSRKNNKLIVKIGDANKLVSGIQNYKIEYQIFGAIRFFDNYDEFYWNVTGNDWQVPILSASAKVSADFEFLNGTSSSCYTGPVGSAFKNCNFLVEDDKKSIDFTTVGSLAAGNGLTFSVLLPKGEVDPILAEEGFKNNNHSISVAWFFAIFIPAVGIFLLFFIWVIVISTKKLIGDRRLKNRPIVVQYGPSEGFSLAEAAFVAHRNLRASDISPVIIKLAVDGFIKIVYPKQNFFFKDNYELVKAKNEEGIKDDVERKVFDYLFAGGGNSVKIDDLDRKSGSILLRNLGTSVKNELHQKSVFEKKNLFYSRLSEKGLDLLWKLFGFSKFLEATEKERLEMLNAPDLKPEIFEKFLPYAMVLGAEKKWAKKFEHIFVTPPSWVEGYPAGRHFNSLVFVNSMNSFGRSVSSHSTYSSGGGGGGHSGGGSGGGGGGSW